MKKLVGLPALWGAVAVVQVAQLTRLLELVMNNAWDADVLCSRDGNARRLRAKISHDEWYQLLGFVTA